MILIGSRALTAQVSGYRKPKDYDWIATEEEAVQYISDHNLKWEYLAEGKYIGIDAAGVIHEFDISESPSNQLLRTLVPQDTLPSLDLLFTIKKSHRFKKDSPHFWKTLADYHYLKSLGHVVRPEHEEFLATREKETYTNNLPKLNVSKTSFFDEAHGVTYKYDHDTTHEAVALQATPAYRYFLKGEVWTSKELFFQQSREIQLHSVIEEAMVLSIERSLVPFPGVMTPLQAWRFALSKIMSSISSGWWREFAYENALTILKMFPEGYWERAQEKGFTP